jgi:hypothetical protein
VTAVLAVLAGAGTWTAVATDEAPPVHRADRALDMDGVRIDTSYFTGGGTGRRPAVLLGHGFGGSKDDVRAQAERLARDGYAVLTWSARGFGASTGRIGLNDPDHEVRDVRKLIDWLAARPEVLLDAPGDPRVGVTGASYGGAISLLAAGHDPRVDAIAPQITYWNLADALLPNGVHKKLWAGILFSAGATPAGPSVPARPADPATPPAGQADPGAAPGGAAARTAAGTPGAPRGGPTPAAGSPPNCAPSSGASPSPAPRTPPPAPSWKPAARPPSAPASRRPRSSSRDRATPSSPWTRPTPWPAPSPPTAPPSPSTGSRAATTAETARPTVSNGASPPGSTAG